MVVYAQIDADAAVLPGFISDLATLPEHTLIHKKGLAQLFGCSERTIQRAVNRGELPGPVRMFGKVTWTIGAVIKHVEKRLEKEAATRHNLEQRVIRHRP
jgi:predicted DNA-binding transcriptional regulator AlpA